MDLRLDIPKILFIELDVAINSHLRKGPSQGGHIFYLEGWGLVHTIPLGAMIYFS